MTLEGFTTALTGLETVEAQIKRLEDQLISARNEIVDARYAVWSKVKRARDGAKSKHGDDRAASRQPRRSRNDSVSSALIKNRQPDRSS